MSNINSIPPETVVEAAQEKSENFISDRFPDRPTGKVRQCLVVMACFLASLSSFLMLRLTTILLSYLQKKQNFSNFSKYFKIVSLLGYSLTFGIGSLGQAYYKKLNIDKTLIIGCILGSIGLVGGATSQNFWQIILFIPLCCGISCGGAYFVIGKTFEKLTWAIISFWMIFPAFQLLI